MNKLKLNYRLNSGTVQLIINYGHKVIAAGKSIYKPLKLTTGIADRHDSFDLKTGRFDKSNPDYRNLNLSLQKTESKIQELFQKLEIEHTDVSLIEPDVIKSMLIGEMSKSITKKPVTKIRNLFTLLHEYVEALTTMGKLDRLSVYNYKQTISTLQEFKQGEPLLESDLTIKFHSEYFDFLAKKGLSNNTLWRFQKALRTLFKYLKMQGVVFGYDYLSAQIRVSYKAPQNIALTIPELKIIYSHNSKKAYLNRIKHLFIFQALTGVRYSDVNKFVEMSICSTPDGDKYKCFEIQTEKTGAKVNIPVMQIAAEIYKMYDGVLPEISNQKYNKYLTELLNEIDYFALERTKTVYENKKKQVVKYTIASQVTTHTARRSFATIMFNLGCPVRTIMAITSHTKLETFFNYIKLNSDDSSQMLNLKNKFDAGWNS